MQSILCLKSKESITSLFYSLYNKENYWVASSDKLENLFG